MRCLAASASGSDRHYVANAPRERHVFRLAVAVAIVCGALGLSGSIAGKEQEFSDSDAGSSRFVDFGMGMRAAEFVGVFDLDGTEVGKPIGAVFAARKANNLDHNRLTGGNLIAAGNPFYFDNRGRIQLSSVPQFNASFDDESGGWGGAKVPNDNYDVLATSYDSLLKHYAVNVKVGSKLHRSHFLGMGQGVLSRSRTGPSVIGGLFGPMSGTPRGQQSAAPNGQSRYTGDQRPKRPICRISSGVCGLPLSAKIALTVILSGLATAIWSRSYWLFLDGKLTCRRMAGAFALGWCLLGFTFLAVAWAG